MIFTQNTQSAGCSCSSNTMVSIECSNCGFKGFKVTAVTIKSQLKKDTLENVKSSLEEFNFCNNPQCDTVYYSNNGDESFNQMDIKSKVTIKNDDPKTPLCYCRKLLKQDVLKMIEAKEENIAAKIKAILSEGKSFCEKSNPKGICCTEDIKIFLTDYGINWNEPKQLFSINPPSNCC